MQPFFVPDRIRQLECESKQPAAFLDLALLHSRPG
jgi:hypothetical protein